MSKIVHLRTFHRDELKLSEEEARLVLVFFWPEHSARISGIDINDSHREFAQALLVEAIDASYSMGYIDALAQGIIAAMMPIDRARPVRKLIREFAKEASLHWFEHATMHDLSSVKIYETVRRAMSRSFKTIFEMHLNNIAKEAVPFIFVDYASALDRSKWYWS